MKLVFGASGVMRFARDLPKLITFEPPPCIWFIRKIQNPISKMNGRNDPISAVHEKPPVPFESQSTWFACRRSWNFSCAWSDA